MKEENSKVNYSEHSLYPMLKKVGVSNHKVKHKCVLRLAL